ncbi:MAG: FtsX-like permease family protein [Anaerolineales bacterium]|nr:FtsX-like permease family protein [Anaerolineales bacterium]
MNPLPSLNLLRTGWRYLVRHPWESGLMVFGIALGVAVVIAIDLANASARRAFDLSIDSVAGKATHQITAAPLPLEDVVYADLRLAFPEEPMAPVVAEFATSEELGGIPLQILGIDPYAEAPFRDYINLSAEQGQLPDLAAFLTRPGALLISSNLAARYGFSACAERSNASSDCTLNLNIGGLSRPAQISGLITPTSGASAEAVETLALMDVSTAQELTGGLGQLSTIDLLLPEDSQALQERIQAVLPEGARLEEVAARSGALFQITSAFRLNLTALSLLALIVGLFLIYNTMTVTTLRRRPLYGLLRCLGVTRREIYFVVVAEALMVGILGSILGVALGIFLGRESVRLVSQTINDLYFVVSVQASSIPAGSLLKGAALGILTTVLAAALPAREAASVPPRAALVRSTLESKSRSTVRLAALVGVLCTLLGLAALWFPDSGLVLSFTGTFLIIVGFASMTPAVTVGLMRLLERPLGRLASLQGRMAPRSVVASISRTSIATAALMVAVSVSIGLSLMVESFRFTVEDWLSQTLRGDIYISSPGVAAAQTSTIIFPEVIDLLESRADIAQIGTIRVVQVDSPDGPIQLGAVNDPHEAVKRPFMASIGSPAEVAEAMQAGALLISEPLARRLELPVEGAGLTLTTPAGLQTFDVAGIYYDYGNTQGFALMDQAVYLRSWNDPAVTAVSVNLAEGSSTTEVARDLQEQLAQFQQLEVQPNQALRANALEIFDRTFQITTSLQGLVTLVAFTGVLSALLSLQLEKGRELSILSAVGLTGRQLSGLVFLESGLMGAIAGVLSMPTGFVLSLILIYIINRRAFGWTLQLEMTSLPFLQALGIAILAALIAAIYPAWRITRQNTAAGLRGE